MRNRKWSKLYYLISKRMSDIGTHRMTYACGHSSISNSDILNTNLMYSIRDVRQISGEDERCINSPRPFRMICLCSGYVLALHTVCVDLWLIAICSGGIDLNGVRDLVAIHWLRKMNLNLDGFCRCQTIVMPGEKSGDHWSWRYVFLLCDEYFIAPSPKRELGKATSESLLGVVV